MPQDLPQRVELAIVRRSPVERQIAFVLERGWRYLPFVRAKSDDFSIDLGA